MAKSFDYSKWDKIELSDDEADCHPNIDKESWFRMKHRSRVEREDNEKKDIEKIKSEMEKASQRIKQIQYDLNKLSQTEADNSDSEDDDIDINDRQTLQTELDDLVKANTARQNKLNEYEKNRKWNVDNMFEVKEERTVVNPNAGKLSYTETGFVLDKEQISNETKNLSITEAVGKNATKSAAGKSTSATATKPAKKSTPVTVSSSSTNSSPKSVGPEKPSSRDQTKHPEKHGVVGAFETYHEFTQKHSDRVEQFMALTTFEESKIFLLKYGDILLQENACNYLLLASLEDEMNGYREKMKRTARQSQIITNIAELAKTLQTHPGNVIIPFFKRLEQREPLDEFLSGCSVFVDRIIQRAIVKKAEMDEERRKEEGARSLDEIPIEERLGPGGLDPLDVIQSLPPELQDAFQSRDVDQLKNVLSQMNPAEAQYHMKRCIDSGLWVSQDQHDADREADSD